MAWRSLAIGGLIVWGVRDTRDIINPVTVLGTSADVDAIRWIDDHVPARARFFINVTLWQGATYRGVDGGYWIMPLSGRDTLVSPALYPQGGYRYATQVNALAKQAVEIERCDGAFWDLVAGAGLTHVYLGPEKGPLRPEGLAGCGGLRVIYNTAGVTIYEIAPPP